MDKAREAPTGKAGAAQWEEKSIAPWSLGVPDRDRIPGDTDRDPEADLVADVAAEEEEPLCQDRLDLAAVGRDDSWLLRPEARKQKIDSKGRKAKKQKVEEDDSKKMQTLFSAYSEARLQRYEMYRRSAFPRGALERLMESITGSSVSENVLIAMAGISKVFVGEVVEAILDVCEQRGERPPLQPKHLREAVRRLTSKGKIPKSKHRRIF
ncbi:transcription initiation factor TFIID subunit 11-like [Choloepus didactylus]|uniref:transcription initiation factor TFIID subunit 11-like n=1 Tax=Choloepus didactylus TaxID=27675 RepID=UPI0018A0EBDE|nr:transcription initiation factor TFIID subunit 11-like [Choloepus didactylus]